MKKLSFLLIFAVASAPTSIRATHKTVKSSKTSDKTKTLIGSLVGGLLLVVGTAYGYNKYQNQAHGLNESLITYDDEYSYLNSDPYEATGRFRTLLERYSTMEYLNLKTELEKQAFDLSQLTLDHQPIMQWVLKNKPDTLLIKLLTKHGALIQSEDLDFLPKNPPGNLIQTCEIIKTFYRQNATTSIPDSLDGYTIIENDEFKPGSNPRLSNPLNE